MLSENVLADLARRSPSQSMLVTAAWPSLSTESRLQVIAAVQGDGASPHTPDWLLDLAMQDSAEIVRYWAARAAWFRKDRPEGLDRVATAQNDPSAIVRFSVERGLYDYDALTAMSQQQRLIAIRNQDPSLLGFIDWLEKAIDTQVSDADLRDCAAEYIAIPEVIKDMREEPSSIEADYREGKAVTKGWALLKDRAGPGLTLYLAEFLPVERGMCRIEAEDLAAMPAEVLKSILYRQWDHKTFMELASLVRKQPERFPPEVVKSLETDDEWGSSSQDYQSPDERKDRARRHAVDRQATMLDTVLEIRRELQRLHERLNEVEAVASRKRGFFG
jgi:hypothetical protein